MPTMLVPLDLKQNELRNAVVQNLAAAPSTPVKGQLYFDTSSNSLYFWDGTTWQVAKGGTGGPPTGTAGGDLSGTYPNPTVIKLNGTQLSVLATGILKNTTGTGVPSIAAAADVPTVAAGATGPLSATDATTTNSRAPSGSASGDLSGTYPGPTVVKINGTALSGLATGVLKNTTATGVPSIAAAADVPVVAAGTSAAGPMSAQARLDQVASANPPAASVTMGSNRIVNVADPTAITDAATKNYVDNVAAGLDAKQSVKAASTANLTQSGTQTIDGISCTAGDRVLCKDQTTQANNGIWVVSAGAWSRATDMDAWTEVPSAYTFVEQGTVNADTGWVCTADQGGTLNTTAITWTQFSGAGSIVAGNGLTKTGQQIDFVAGDTSLTVAADSVVVNTAVIATVASVNTAVTGMVKKYAGSLAGSVAYATGEILTHNLNTRDITVAVINNASPYNAIEVDWEATTTTTATIRYNSNVVNPTGYRVVITG
jgi:hypothetical protein